MSDATSNDTTEPECEETWAKAPMEVKTWCEETFAKTRRRFKGPVVVFAVDETADYVIGRAYTAGKYEQDGNVLIRLRIGGPFDMVCSDGLLEMMSKLGKDLRIVGTAWEGTNIIREREIIPAERSKTRRFAHIALELMTVVGYLQALVDEAPAYNRMPV